MVASSNSIRTTTTPRRRLGQFFAKLVADGAIAIAGSPDTGPITAELAIRYKFPTIGVVDDGGLTVNTDGPTGPPNPWVFDFGLNTFAWGEKIGEYALKHCPDGLAVLHDPSTYGQGGLYGIKLAYDKAGKKIAIDHAITENWSTGATAGLMPEVNATKDGGHQMHRRLADAARSGGFPAGPAFGRLHRDRFRQ